MKKIFILAMTSLLLASCFNSSVQETQEDIVSNIVDLKTSTGADLSQSGSVDEDDTQEAPEQAQEDIQEPIVSGSENDPRVDNTQGEGTNTPETQSPSVETETSSDTEQDIKVFEDELESLFDDIFEASEG